VWCHDPAALHGCAQRVAGHGTKRSADINEPGTSRNLKTLPGSWSDLALACLIHLGMERLMTDEDSGLGIGADYGEIMRV